MRVLAAMQDQKIDVPIVVRLAGTNVEKGAAMLEEAGLDFIMADNLDDAAKSIVKLVKEAA